MLKVENSQAISRLRPLPLAERVSNPGELVAVVGYPMGVLGMVAKSPSAVYERLAYRRDDIGAANELAALSLIRPSATCGHLGDVVGDKLIYDAPTAHGGSGGPVFNSQGQVIGINEAYIDGFSGGTLGVSVQALRPSDRGRSEEDHRQHTAAVQTVGERPGVTENLFRNSDFATLHFQTSLFKPGFILARFLCRQPDEECRSGAAMSRRTGWVPTFPA